MIDWIQIRKERRFKVVAVRQQAVEDYLLVSEFPDVRTIDVYENLPKHWMVAGVSYDAMSRSFVFAILSPEFEPVLDGAEAESIPARREAIWITREAV